MIVPYLSPFTSKPHNLRKTISWFWVCWHFYTKCSRNKGFGKNHLVLKNTFLKYYFKHTYLDFDLDREWDSECLETLDGLRDPDLLSDFTWAGVPVGDFDWERDS